MAATATAADPRGATGADVAGVLLRLTILIITVLAGVTLIAWLLLGLTVMPTVRAGGELWLVKRAAWTEGAAPSGSVALAQTHPVKRDPLARAALLISPGDDNAVLTILARPTDKVTVDKQHRIHVNGVATSTTSSQHHLQFHPTDNAYLAVCDTGACTPGALVKVGVDQVLGKVVARLPIPFTHQSTTTVPL